MENYYFRLIDKHDQLNKRNNNVQLIIGILISVYFLVDMEVIEEVNVMGFKVENLELSKLIIPLFVAYAGIIYETLNSYRTQIENEVDDLGKRIFEIDNDIDFKNVQRVLKPYSMFTELHHYSKGASLLSIFLALPALGVLLAPYIFEFYALKYLVLNHWSDNLFSKLVILATIWIIIVVFVFHFRRLNAFIKRVSNQNNDNTQ